MPNLQEYQFQSLLRGAIGPINTLLFSTNGNLLLAGGDDAKVRIWNTATYETEGVLTNNGKWGQITFLTWLHIDKPIDNKSVALAVGTGRGNVTLCPFVQGRLAMSQSRTFTSFDFNDAVEAMSFDRVNSRLAISSHTGQVKVLTVSGSLGLQSLWHNTVDAAIPRALFFHGANNSLLMTLSLETGELCCREADSGSRLWAKPLEGAIGNAALSSDQSTLIIDNLSNQCFDIYTVPSCHRKMAPLVFSSTLRFPKQCVFSDGAQVAICGSTTNKVYVVDVTSSDIIQTLVGGDECAMLQTVAATPGNRSGAFVAGGSTNGDVYLWKTKADKCDEENTISSISMAQKTPASQPEKDIGSSINYNLTIFQSAVLGSIAWFVLIFCFPRGLLDIILSSIESWVRYLREVPE